MGLQDRDYSREPSYGASQWGGGPSGGPSWGGGGSWMAGSARSITVTLIIINVVIFFLDIIFSGSQQPGGQARSVMLEWFAVRSDTLIKPWTWYRFLTYGFVHAIDDIRHILFNMLGLFIFGRIVEQQIRSAEFLRFYLVGIVFGGFVASAQYMVPAMLTGGEIAPHFTVGASGAVIAVTILFAFMNPQATVLLMLIIPIKAWLLAVFFVISNLLGWIGGHGQVAYGVHLAGIVWAAAYHTQRWQLDFLNLDLFSRIQGVLKSRRPKLRLHDPEKKLAQQEAEVDRILDKIQATGLDSLTSAERKTLERHSKLKRQQQQQR
jgi:membrane associated rhomboid family serine protease